ncbi:MAG TPA: adenylate/guanylate cyclase domain-containing protein [Chthoniobacteraceae bacterium]
MTNTLTATRLERTDGSVLALPGNLTIGRSPGNGLVLPTERASRRHASIHAQDGGEFWLIDLGSVNGTFLNSRRVFQPVRLRDGDSIDIAGERLLFRQEESAADSEMLGATVVTMPKIERERCWLLVADIEEFTQLSQRLEPQQLAVAVGQWVRESREVIEKHGGVINKYLGDGYLAFWREAPSVNQQIAAALVANRALQAAGGLKFRLVLHFGEVLFGGVASLSEECLMGPEVNFLFRMEKVAGAFRAPIMFSDAARAEIESLMPCEPVPGEHELKGFAGQHRFHVLKS